MSGAVPCELGNPSAIINHCFMHTRTVFRLIGTLPGTPLVSTRAVRMSCTVGGERFGLAGLRSNGGLVLEWEALRNGNGRYRFVHVYAHQAGGVPGRMGQYGSYLIDYLPNRMMTLATERPLVAIGFGALHPALTRP